MDQEKIEYIILLLLEKREEGKSICPSDAARTLSPDDWRPLMQDVRVAARNLVRQGKIEITQKGEVVDPEQARGPIRLRKSSS